MKKLAYIKSLEDHCIITSDIKIFDPVNRRQMMSIDNKHDYLKVKSRAKKLKKSEICFSNMANRAERIGYLKETYPGHSIKELKELGFTV